MKDQADNRAVDAFDPPEPKPFVDIRNQRLSTAGQKATLCLQLRMLCTHPPRSVIDSGIGAVRAWKSVMDDCWKVLKKTNSTVPQLESAINRMRAFK